MEIEVVEADITRLAVDAIVNAANNRMRGGGGVDGAIHRAAGPELLAECEERFPHGLATGDAGWTHGFRLPATWVIHVVGPVYDGVGDNRGQLESCYRRALEVADTLRGEASDFTIAFPLVSAGVYGWPREDAARTAVRTLRSAPTQVTRAILVGYDAGAAELLRAAVAETA